MRWFGIVRRMAGRLTHQVVVRVSDELHRLLVADSEDNGRTIAQTIRLHLTRHYLGPEAG